MKPEHLAEGLRLLELCAASPDDPQARCVEAWVRQTMDARSDDPFASHMRGLLSNYALAIVLSMMIAHGSDDDYPSVKPPRASTHA